MVGALKPMGVRVLFLRHVEKHRMRTPVGFNASAMLRHWFSRCLGRTYDE